MPCGTGSRQSLEIGEYACTHKSVVIDAGIATSAFRSKADVRGTHLHVRLGPCVDGSRTMPKSWQLVGRSIHPANDTKKPTAEESGNKREEIGRCEGADFLRALNANKPD